MFVTDDPEREWEPVAVAEKYRRDIYVNLIKGSQDHKEAAAERSGPKEQREPIPLNPLNWTVGDAEHCVKELAELIEVNGITDLVTWGGPPGLSPSVMNESLTRMAKEVIPRLRSRLNN